MSNPEANTAPPRKVRWGLLLVLAIVAVLLLGGVLILAGLASLTRGRTVTVKPDSTLVLALDRPLQESQPDPIMTDLFKAKVYSVYDVVSALDRAARDERIKGLLLDVNSFPAGFGKVQELREAVARFESSKKPVWAYFESAGNGGYYLACTADKVYAPPSANLLLSGLAAEVPFYRGVLDKLRIEPQLYHIGAYKSYSDTFMRKDMSDAQREATNAILDSLYGQLVDGIAKGRHLPPDQVQATVDMGFLWGSQIKERGLVDDLLYEDQVEDGLKKLNGNTDSWHHVEMADYIRDHRVELSAGARKGLALVLASGGIVSGEGDASAALGESNMGSTSVVNWLRKAGRNEDVQAVVMRVDSPGGSALASDMIWRQVEVLRKTKPVIVSMSDVAGSGGYYIAMGADAIVAQPGTITGSIGVVSGKFVLRGLMDWIDYRQETLKRGRNADIFSSYQPFTPEQEQIIQDQMAGFYKEFVSKAAQGRKMTYESVDKIAQGRIWSGEDALRIGLVDRLGGLHEAMALAKEKMGLKKDDPVRVVIYPRPKTFLEAFFQGGMEDVARWNLTTEIPPELLEAYREYLQVKPLASEPFVLYTPVTIRSM